MWLYPHIEGRLMSGRRQMLRKYAAILTRFTVENRQLFVLEDDHRGYKG